MHRSLNFVFWFAQANQSRLPLAMGIVQPHIPVRRMASERKTQLTDAFVRILRRFLTPATISMDVAHDSHYREHLLPLAAHGDGHVLTVSIALLLAILTGRSVMYCRGLWCWQNAVPCGLAHCPELRTQGLCCDHLYKRKCSCQSTCGSIK